MSTTHIHLTRHAEQMLIERRIKRAWVERTISQPDIVESDPVRSHVVRAFKRIPEHGNRFLRVAYVRSGESVRVLTVFFDRNRTRLG